MTLPPFALIRPATLDEAFGELSDEQVPYCGGTELLLAMRAGLQRPAALVDLKRLPELTGIRVDGGHLVIGAVERHMDIAAHPEVRSRLPMVAAMEKAVGNARVRAQGSMGGNLCFAEPKSDVATALVALDAAVTVAGRSGRRSVLVEDFVAGPYFADKEPDELLVDIRIPVRRDQRAVYVKYQTAERPTVGVAAVYDAAAGRCRVAVGAVGEVPVVGTYDSPDRVDVADLVDRADPVADLTGSEEYKRHVTAVFVRRALQRLAAEVTS